MESKSEREQIADEPFKEDFLQAEFQKTDSAVRYLAILQNRLEDLQTQRAGHERDAQVAIVMAKLQGLGEVLIKLLNSNKAA